MSWLVSGGRRATSSFSPTFLCVSAVRLSSTVADGLRTDVTRLKDETYNIPDNVLQKVGVSLHRKEKHPISAIKKRVHDHFTKLNRGFQFFDELSPVVTTAANFDSLLIKPDHPSRAPTDTYYVNKSTILRTHTSAHQAELMRKGHKHFLVTGDVYRRDEIDRSHYPVFHQVEGVSIFKRDDLRKQHGLRDDNELSKWVERDLKSTLEGMVGAVFPGKLQFMWKDEYFPFTHPSFELEILFKEKWLEVLGSGVIHPDVLNPALDSDEYIGWAFGIGLDRLAMLLFNIPDVRLFWSEDARFLKQFEQDSVVEFKPYSKFPPCHKDLSFWVLDAAGAAAAKKRPFHANDFFETVRTIAGDLVEDVALQSTFKHPKTGRESVCYRINYRSMDRTLLNPEIDSLQQRVRTTAAEKLAIELR